MVDSQKERILISVSVVPHRWVIAWTSKMVWESMGEEILLAWRSDGVRTPRHVPAESPLSPSFCCDSFDPQISDRHRHFGVIRFTHRKPALTVILL